MSARKGGVVVGIACAPLGATIDRSMQLRRRATGFLLLGDAQVRLQPLGVAGELGAVSGKHDASAIQYHGAIGEAQNLSSLLLNDDCRHTLLADDLAQDG